MSCFAVVLVGAFADWTHSPDAELIWQWREIILRIIYEPVSISGDDATGDEYAERAEQQEKLDCYLEAYGSLLSEWRCGLTGERSALYAIFLPSPDSPSLMLPTPQ